MACDGGDTIEPSAATSESTPNEMLPVTVDCLASGADCTLRMIAEQGDVMIGAAVRPELIKTDPDYVYVLTTEFNSITAEGSMKWDALHPDRHNYDFGPADELVEFAEANRMAVRGHTLIWAQQIVDSTPDYVKDITNPSDLRDLMTEHIHTVVGHYRGRVDCWDVVNEPLDTFGNELHNNIFNRLLGPGYIAEAFHIAHQADPEARLFLNEVGISVEGPRVDAFLALVKDLIAEGVPIHGVGIQGHYLSPINPDELHNIVQTFADLGLMVEITELDIMLHADEENSLDSQRREYYDVINACLSVPDCRRITMWGFTDRYTWFDSFFGPGLDPLPFDEEYGRKPAYFGIYEALLNRIET